MHTKTVGTVLLVLAISCIAIASISAMQEPQGVSPSLDFAALGRDAVTELAARQFDKVFAQFNNSVAAAMPADKLAKTWDEVLGEAGAFQKIISSRVAERSGYHNAVISCAFQKGSINIIFSYDDRGHIAGLHFNPAQDSQIATAGSSWSAPPYADQTKFHEESVTVSEGQWQLPGTLTLPHGKGPFSAVVLVSGSGPNDADETNGPNKVFKDVAWGLGTDGIAVLRYAKRTNRYGAKSAADPLNLTVKDEYIDDARAAVLLLASRSEINPKHIFLAGHSFGGYLAPRIAAGDPRIAGIVILEGETRPLEQISIDQLRYEAKLGGRNAPKIEKLIPEAQKEAQAMESPDLMPGTVVSFLDIQFPASYLLDLRGYNPAEIAATLKIPIYVTQGGRDYQITTSDFANWQKALAGHSNATLKLYPPLNHLLIAGSGPSKPEEYLIPGHVSSELVSDLAAWINSSQ